MSIPLTNHLAPEDAADALRADARGLLAVAAGVTFAVLLVILPSARRLEPAAMSTPGVLTIGSP